MAKITVNGRGGEQTIESSLTLEQAHDILQAKPNKSEFETDLCAHYRRWGNRLTFGRQKWLVFLAQEHLDRQANPAPARPTVSLGVSFQPIQDLFDLVRGKLQRPRFRLQTRDGRPVHLMLAGGGSQYAGTVSVTTGEPYGTPGSFYGRINRDGTTTVRDEGVIELLKRFAADPAGTAAAYGKLTGGCCFCKTPLTDERSLAVGYGPDCARNYSLPWGNRPAKATPKVEPARVTQEKALPEPAVSLPPWNAPAPAPAANVAPVAEETPSEALTLEHLLLGCSPHRAGHDQLPLFVL